MDIVTGRTDIIGNLDAYSSILDKISSQATAHLLLTSASKEDVFVDAPLDTNLGVRVTYIRLKDMAIAWATPGTALYNDENALEKVLEGVRRANAKGYNPTIEEYGNWWTWEVGASFDLVNILAVVFDHLTQEEIDSNCAAIDFYVPDPWFSKPQGRGRAPSTGTGRVNLCKVIIVRSLLDGDYRKFEHARAGLPSAWAVAQGQNGFHKDGSYITHNTVAYNGSYGIEMPKILADIFRLLEATPSAGREGDFFKLIEKAFLPIVYRGQVLDSLRGRSITRSDLRSRDEASKLIEAIVKMHKSVDEETEAHWMGRCKSWLAELGGTLALDSVNRVTAQRQLEEHPATPIPEMDAVHLFGRMDRVFVRTNGWAIGISGASSQVAFYEPGNGENPFGFYTGAGMTTLYNDDIDQFDDNFWPTVDWYRLPGTTADQLRLPDNAGGTFGRALCNGEWTGGSAISETEDEGGVVFGQHVVGLGGTGLQARKFWLIGCELVVALGCGIDSTSGEDVETIVENRNLHEGFADGFEVLGTKRVLELRGMETVQEPRWAYLPGVGGYHFHPGQTLKAIQEERVGSWSEINSDGPSERIARKYLTLSIDHGKFPDGSSYAYAILPNRTREAVEQFVLRPDYQVLSNTKTVQSVEIGSKLRGYVFWAAGVSGGVSASGPGTLLMRDEGDRTIIAATPHGEGDDFVIHFDAELGPIVSAIGFANFADSCDHKIPVGAQAGKRIVLLRGNRAHEAVLEVKNGSLLSQLR